jgi:hypothetical protein
MRQTWQGVLVSSQVDGAALATSTTETSILPQQAKYTLPANFLNDVGQTLRWRVMGRISTVVTTPGTLTFRIKFGATAVVVTPALALNVAAKTNVTWILELDAVLRGAAGSAASLIHSGAWQSEAVIGSPAAGAGGAAAHIIPAVAPAVGATFDSTAAQQVDLTAQWSVSSASNSIQCHTYKLEAIN